MLLRFKVENYRSIRDEAILDFEAAGLADHKECLLKYKSKNYLPVISINGKNGGGKSNVVRAMWFAIAFVRNAQRTQIEKTPVPVSPFKFNDYSEHNPTRFSFEYVNDGIWYDYGFSATKEEITEEHLYWAPKGQKAMVFNRNHQDYTFPTNSEKKIKSMLSKAVAPNQLFFSIASTMNYKPVIKAMRWFRTKIFFSRDYSDLGHNLISYSNDSEMLKSMVNIAKIADLGIQDMQFEINNQVIQSLDELPDTISSEQKVQLANALKHFKQNLSGNIGAVNRELQYNELKATSFHNGIDQAGHINFFPLSLMEESDGTLNLMARSAAMELALRDGGILIVDEIENRLHPKLVEYIVNRFQYHNTTNAQLVFTTHSVDIMNREMLRRDQYYLVDKDSRSGVTELYSIADFSIRNDEKIGKAYLLGKYGAIPFVMEE